MPLENAAVQVGIPIEEVFQYVTDRAGKIDTLNFELRLAGQGALKNALTKLTELATGDVREGLNFESTDLEAAKALAKFGIDALKLAKTGQVAKDEGKEEKDLFDAANPWSLKKIE